MKRTRRKMPSIIAVALVLSTLMVLASTAFAATSANIINTTPRGESIHEKIDISDITGEIAEPPELTSAASALAKEKEWYEYVYYSKDPVGYYYLNDNTRLAFYDPYDYANSLIMEVNDDITDWSSMNTMQVSYTTGHSLTETVGESSDVTTTVQKVDGKDVSTTTGGDSTTTTKVKGRIETYNYSKSGDTTTSQDKLTQEQLWDASTFNQGTVVIKAGLTDLGMEGSFTWEGASTTTQDQNYSYAGENWGTKENGYTEDNTETTTTTKSDDTVVTTEIAKRITTATGYADSSSMSMSTEDSTTVTKTYEAGYFNANGAPLQWKIIHYKVMMPMKYQLEFLVDDEWVFGDYNYCLLTTIQGTCRSWLQNNVAYYEHWGTGEPVTWDEFWNQFFTKENLIKAYQSKLYPEN